MVYNAANNAHFHFPVSFFIAAIVARHGKYSNIKTRYEAALCGDIVWRTAFCNLVVSSEELVEFIFSSFLLS